MWGPEPGVHQGGCTCITRGSRRILSKEDVLVQLGVQGGYYLGADQGI